MSELEQAALEGAAPEVVSEETTSEATENTEGQVEGQPDQTEEKSKAQQRRERREAAIRHSEQEKEAAITRAAELEKRLDRIKAAREGEAPPKEDDFPDVIEFAAARALWKQRQADAQSDAAEISSEAGEHRQKAQELEAQVRAERAAEFADQIAEKRTQYADLDQVLAVAQRADVVSNHVAEMVLASDVAVDLAYHLGKNPAVARQISQLPPLQAARRKLSHMQPKATASMCPSLFQEGQWRLTSTAARQQLWGPLEPISLPMAPQRNSGHSSLAIWSP